MTDIRFTREEAWILYTIPKPPVSIADIIKHYIFANRDAAPPFELLRDVLSKAMVVGIIARVENGSFVLSDEWFAKIHEWDEKCPDEIESMIEFSEDLISKCWKPVRHSAYALTKDEYEEAVRQG